MIFSKQNFFEQVMGPFYTMRIMVRASQYSYCMVFAVAVRCLKGI